MNFTPADVMRKAASRLEEEGMWCRDAPWLIYGDLASEAEKFSSQGIDAADFVVAELNARQLRVPECAIGALYSAAYELTGNTQLGRLASSYYYLTKNQTISWFNDAIAADAHEVAEALRSLADTHDAEV